jgi:hypothetical protein
MPGRFDLHDVLFEFFVGDDRAVFDLCFVGVDGVDGVFEDAGDLFGLVDAHADEGGVYGGRSFPDAGRSIVPVVVEVAKIVIEVVLTVLRYSAIAFCFLESYWGVESMALLSAAKPL